MWNVTKKFETAVMDAQSSEDFRVSSTRGVMHGEKYDCAAEVRRMAGGCYQMTILPTLLINGEELGSTCQVTKYDRLPGRPGDVPDKSVGIKMASEQ
jgi:hypothetical protein